MKKVIKYKVEDIQNVLSLLNEISVTGLKGMERMVAAATILEHGTIIQSEKTEEKKEQEENQHGSNE